MYTLGPLGQGLFDHIYVYSLPRELSFPSSVSTLTSLRPGPFPGSSRHPVKRQKGVYPVPFPTASFLLFPLIATMLVTCVFGGGRVAFFAPVLLLPLSPFRCEALSAVSHRTAGYGQTRTRDRSWSVFLGASQTVPSFPLPRRTTPMPFCQDERCFRAPFFDASRRLPRLSHHVPKHMGSCFVKTPSMASGPGNTCVKSKIPIANTT